MPVNYLDNFFLIMHYDRKIFLFTNKKKFEKAIASNEISMVTVLSNDCPQSASKLLISHNFSNHYKTMMWPSWRLQGCKEVGPFRDIDWGNSGETAEQMPSNVSLWERRKDGEIICSYFFIRWKMSCESFTTVDSFVLGGCASFTWTLWFNFLLILTWIPSVINSSKFAQSCEYLFKTEFKILIW